MTDPTPSVSGARRAGEYDSVTLHSSWTGILLAGAGAATLAGIAVVVLVVNGFGVFPILLAIAALGCSVAVLFDMPIASTFDAEGVTRRTPLRRHRLAWPDVTRLLRNRSVILRRRTGGLVACIGPVRQVMLVDRMEGHQEYAAIRQVLSPDDRILLDPVDEPPLDRTPTWIHRAKRWHPPSAT